MGGSCSDGIGSVSPCTFLLVIKSIVVRRQKVSWCDDRKCRGTTIESVVVRRQKVSWYDDRNHRAAKTKPTFRESALQ
ncbi:MAG: hypothetical protein ACEPOZ_21245 [Marinifilaceae bacterium]